MTLGMVVVAIPLLILLGIILFNLFRGQSLVGAKYNQLELQANARSCQSQAALSAVFFDNDFGRNQGDGYPDSCDVCLGGNDNNDKDLDGFPDACDKDPENQPDKKAKMKDICKGAWNAEKQQCRLDCYAPDKACPRI